MAAHFGTTFGIYLRPFKFWWLEVLLGIGSNFNNLPERQSQNFAKLAKKFRQKVVFLIPNIFREISKLRVKIFFFLFLKNKWIFPVNYIKMQKTISCELIQISPKFRQHRQHKDFQNFDIVLKIAFWREFRLSGSAVRLWWLGYLSTLTPRRRLLLLPPDCLQHRRRQLGGNDFLLLLRQVWIWEKWWYIVGILFSLLLSKSSHLFLLYIFKMENVLETKRLRQGKEQ